jgi:hypothetical protein
VAVAMLLLLPISVLAVFILKGWVAFIPLGFIIMCLIVLILAHLWSMFRDFKRQMSTL